MDDLDACIDDMLQLIGRLDPREGLEYRRRVSRLRDDQKNVGMAVNTEGIVEMCVVPLCHNPGTIEVIQQVPVRYASGRHLQGQIVHRGKACESCLEGLVKGENLG